MDEVNDAVSIKVAKYLIEKGADINAKNENGKTALIFYVEQDRDELAKFLIELGPDLYETDQYDDTALHYAVRCNSSSFVEYMLKYYDVNKCNKINPILEDVENPKTINLLKKAMGEEIQREKLDMDSLLTEECKPIFNDLKNKLYALTETIKNKNPKLLNKLPNYEDLLTKENFDILYNQFIENIKLWNEIDQPLQAIYMEHAGAVTSPYDPYGMFYGFKECDDSLVFKKSLFSETGDLILDIIYDGIDDLLEDYDDEYSEIREIFNYTSFLVINLIFANIIKDGNFDSIKIQKPLYFIAGEHDGEKELVYKL